MIDTSILKENKVSSLNELVVRCITGHRFMKDKLQFQTTFEDNTTNWQPEENFYSHDGSLVTEAVVKYFDILDKPFLAAL